MVVQAYKMFFLGYIQWKKIIEASFRPQKHTNLYSKKRKITKGWERYILSVQGAKLNKIRAQLESPTHPSALKVQRLPSKIWCSCLQAIFLPRSCSPASVFLVALLFTSKCFFVWRVMRGCLPASALCVAYSIAQIYVNCADAYYMHICVWLYAHTPIAIRTSHTRVVIHTYA